MKSKLDLSPPYEFLITCPICKESFTATGRSSECIEVAKRDHIMHEHPLEEIIKYYYAGEIAQYD